MGAGPGVALQQAALQCGIPYFGFCRSADHREWACNVALSQSLQLLGQFHLRFALRYLHFCLVAINDFQRQMYAYVFHLLVGRHVPVTIFHQQSVQQGSLPTAATLYMSSRRKMCSKLFSQKHSKLKAQWMSWV